MKLKTLTGRPLRQDFTFFEVEALKKVANENIPAGASFTSGKTVIHVLENSEEIVALKREGLDKLIQVQKVAETGTAEKPARRRKAVTIPAPTAENNQMQQGLGKPNEVQLAEMLAKMLAASQAPAVDMESIRAQVAEMVREELACANGEKELVDFAHDMRYAIKAQGLTYAVSTRAIKRLAMYKQFKGNVDADGMLQCLCGSWSPNDIKSLQNRLFPEEGNEYVDIFKRINF